MTDVLIKKQNETWLKVTCAEQYMEMDIQDRFSFRHPQAQYDPRVKRGHWDGVVKLYNRRTHQFPIGLLLELLSFLNKQDFSYQLDPDLLPEDDLLTREDLEHLVRQINPYKDGKPVEAQPHQYEALQYMLNMGRSVTLSATSAGKSLVIYLAVRIYQLMEDLHDKTIFITVPSTHLVEQLYSDFEEYSSGDDDWMVGQHCQKISGKYSKHIDRQIVLTTWQSQCRFDLDVLERAGVILVDEAHGCSAKVLGQIVKSLINCPYKHGLTGTLNGIECDELTIQGLLGPSKRIIDAHELSEIGFASPIEIKMVMLNHNEKTIQAYQTHLKELSPNHDGHLPPREKYQAELMFLNEDETRRELLVDLIMSLEGNTLVLFDRVENYGKPLFKLAHEKDPGRSFLNVGSVSSTEREAIRTSMEDQNRAIIWASFRTMSTGVSINKLHNAVFLNAGKAKIRVVQSIGRLMRRHDTKQHGIIYDVVDNLKLNDLAWDNYSMSQAQERLKLYSQEQHPVDFIQLNL